MSYGAVTRRRYIVFIVVLMSLFYFLEVALRDAPPFSLSPTNAATSPSLEVMQPPPSLDPPPIPTADVVAAELHPCAGRERANATLLMLARNSDIAGAAASVAQLEDKFNKHCNYPWVFLNEEPFTEDFKTEVAKATNGSVSFGLVQHEHWYQPGWIDEDLARAGRDKMVQQNIIYADSVPYRNMCRFNSGFFFKHELVLPYRYYWRVEPDIEYFCDMPYDPFYYMMENDKIYGFTISFYEWEPTIPTLWSAVKEFVRKYPQYVADDNAMSYLSDDGGETYNLCHCECFLLHLGSCRLNPALSGQISKSRTWISGEAKHTKHSSSSWKPRVAFTMSDGEMRQSTASQWRFSLQRLRCISSKTSATDTVHSSTVRKALIGKQISADATRATHWITDNSRVYHDSNDYSNNLYLCSDLRGIRS
ncbi:Glycosyltransferase family 15 protein [Mycena chlorophos]|uniref:Glycosyltransferase family 15 protein n=1 Tax=Mycena chlorophos TaxID=658473 RepID=A0A8H6WCN1_MYCCL|nr:Glycosyltransferase family 15 protein [Mycena chlorophos]